MTSINLAVCLMICSSVCREPVAVIVMREYFGLTEAETTSASILNPRRANTWAQRTRTPGLLATSMLTVWVLEFFLGIDIIFRLRMLERLRRLHMLLLIQKNN